MRFLRGGGDSQDETAEEQALRLQRAERSRVLVESGGIPLDAEERIRRQAAEGGIWTSDLSVNELSALRALGYEPVAQVLGSSLYRMGWITTGWGGAYGGGGIGGRYGYGYGLAAPQENQMLTRALLEARARAVHRLVLEAQGVRAHGVVGVRLKIQHWDWAQGMSEFTVLGTAVRRVGAAPVEEPFTSTLSGQDMARLTASGHFPVRLVMGASAQQAIGLFGMRMGGFSTWANTEVAPFSRAMHQAQTLAHQRLGMEAGQAGADGVVGVTFTSQVVEFATGSEAAMGRIVEWVILGTAVIPQPGPAAKPRPSMVVRLNDAPNPTNKVSG